MTATPGDDAPRPELGRPAAFFHSLAAGYDNLRFLAISARRLVELAALPPGARVLDLATGTGWAALAAAEAVGPAGRVVGIDAAPGMLEQARLKVEQAGLSNVELRVGDAQKLDYPDETFDAVLCAASLFFMPDMWAALREWTRVLRPGGLTGFSGFGLGLQQPLSDMFDVRLQDHGAKGPAQLPHRRLADPQACHDLLQEAGYEAIEVRSEQLGYYIAGPDEWWKELWYGPRRTELERLAPGELESFKAEHMADAEALTSEQGIWVDVPAHFAFGRKPLHRSLQAGSGG